MSYPERYRRIAAWFRARPRAYWLLRQLNRLLPLVFYVPYPLLLPWLLCTRDARFLRVLLVPFTAFALCTLLRHFIKAPRP